MTAWLVSYASAFHGIVSICKDVPKGVVSWKDAANIAQKKKKALCSNLFLSPCSCVTSLKSFDRIGQNHGFRISAYDGFRIWSKQCCCVCVVSSFYCLERNVLAFIRHVQKLLRRIFWEKMMIRTMIVWRAVCQENVIVLFFPWPGKRLKSLSTWRDSQWKVKVAQEVNGLYYWLCTYLLQWILLVGFEEGVEPSARVGLANLLVIKRRNGEPVCRNCCRKEEVAWRNEEL